MVLLRFSLSLVFLLCFSRLLTPSAFGVITHQKWSRGSTCFFATTTPEEDENAALLEQARKLREEASLLEGDLRSTSSYRTTETKDLPSNKTVNKQLEGSVWTLSYRFSSEPPPKETKDEDNVATTKRLFYSGKLTLLLKEDGYSELLGIEGKDNIEITKVWGWDKETSNEDNLDYLLFSMDVRFPENDPNDADRYYWQARIERESTDGSLSLQEGTVTVKKDVTESTGGMWGFFNVAGILTEFRYCGDFVAKPAAPR